MQNSAFLQWNLRITPINAKHDTVINVTACLNNAKYKYSVVDIFSSHQKLDKKYFGKNIDKIDKNQHCHLKLPSMNLSTNNRMREKLPSSVTRV
jgi:hypothetical protein